MKNCSNFWTRAAVLMLSGILSLFLCCDKGNPINDTRHNPVFGTMTDIDGNLYKTIQIGNQEWMAENLKTTRCSDGTPIPLVADSAAWGALATPGYCWYNNDTAHYGNTYGAIYNWHAVNTGNLAPAGWHVPDTTDWNILENYLVANGYNWDGTTDSNRVAKSMAIDSFYWSFYETQGTVSCDVSTNNRSGLSALPGGIRTAYGEYIEIGSRACWWTSSAMPSDASGALCFNIYYDGVGLDRSGGSKKCGTSIRCVKD